MANSDHILFLANRFVQRVADVGSGECDFCKLVVEIADKFVDSNDTEVCVCVCVCVHKPVLLVFPTGSGGKVGEG